MRQSTKARKKRRKSMRRETYLVLFMAMALVAVLTWRTRDLEEQNAKTLAKIEALQAQVEEEEERSKELEEESLYRQTVDYIEQMARERLGLVYPDEIVITPGS